MTAPTETLECGRFGLRLRAISSQCQLPGYTLAQRPLTASDHTSHGEQRLRTSFPHFALGETPLRSRSTALLDMIAAPGPGRGGCACAPMIPLPRPAARSQWSPASDADGKASYVIEYRSWLDAPHGGKGARAAPGEQTRLIAAATTSSKKFPEPIIRVSRVALRSKSDCELEMSRW